MAFWVKTRKVLSLFSFNYYRKLIPKGVQASFFLKIHRWWNEQLTTIGKAIFTVWLIFCLPSPFMYGKPPFYICIALGTFNLFNYLIAYFLIHLKVEVDRNHSTTTHAGNEISGFITLKNQGFSTLKDIEVFERELPLGATQPEIPFLMELKKNQSVSVPYKIIPNNRGEYTLKAIVVSTTYPFGIIRKVKIKKNLQKIIVYPQILNIEMPRISFGTSINQNQKQKIYDIEQQEYVGNREYAYGDQYNTIDHKAWGRIGYPVTKVYQNDIENSIGIVFLPTYKNLFDEDNFENAIKITSSIIHYLTSRKSIVSYLTFHQNSPEMLLDIAEPEKVFELLAISRKTNINKEELSLKLSELSSNVNKLYIIGADNIMKFSEQIIASIPNDIHTSIILFSEETKRPLPNLPNHMHYILLNNESLKNESVTLA